MTFKSESVSWTAFKINELRTILEDETSEDFTSLKSKKDLVNACRKLDRNVSQKWYKRLRKAPNDEPSEKPPPSHSNTHTTRTYSDPLSSVAAKTPAPPPSTTMHKSTSVLPTTAKVITRAASSIRPQANSSSSKPNLAVPRAPPTRTSIEASRLARQQLNRIPSKGIPANIFSSSSSGQSPLDSEEDVLGARDAAWQSSRRPSSPQTRSKDFDRVEQQLQRSLRLLSSSETPQTGPLQEVDSEVENVKPLPPSLDQYKTPSLSYSKSLLSRPPTCRRQESSRFHHTATYSSARNQTPISTPVLTPLKEAFATEEEATSDPTPLLRPVPVATASQPSVSPQQARSPLLMAKSQADPGDPPPAFQFKTRQTFAHPHTRLASPNKWLYRYSPLLSAVIASLVAILVFLSLPAIEPFHKNVRLCASSLGPQTAGCVPICPLQAVCSDGSVKCEQLRTLIAITPMEWQCLVDDAALDKLLKPITARLRESYAQNGCTQSQGMDMYELLAQVDPYMDPLTFSSALSERYDDVTKRYNIERTGFNLRLTDASLETCFASGSRLKLGSLSLFAFFSVAGFLIYRQISRYRTLRVQVARYIESRTQLKTPELYITGPTIEEIATHLGHKQDLPPSYCSVKSVTHIARCNRDIVMCGLRQSKVDFVFSRSRALALLSDMDQLRLCYTASATPKLKAPLGVSRVS